MHKTTEVPAPTPIPLPRNGDLELLEAALEGQGVPADWITRERPGTDEERLVLLRGAHRLVLYWDTTDPRSVGWAASYHTREEHGWSYDASESIDNVRELADAVDWLRSEEPAWITDTQERTLREAGRELVRSARTAGVDPKYLVDEIECEGDIDFLSDVARKLGWDAMPNGYQHPKHPAWGAVFAGIREEIGDVVRSADGWTVEPPEEQP